MGEEALGSNWDLVMFDASGKNDKVINKNFAQIKMTEPNSFKEGLMSITTNSCMLTLTTTGD